MVAATTIPPKNAIAVLFYDIDWTAWLAGASISGTPSVTVSGPDSSLVVNPTGQSTTVTVGLVQFWLGGGTSGGFYTVAAQITTSDGRTDTRSFLLEIL